MLQITPATKFAMGTWLKKRQCPLLALSGHARVRCTCAAARVRTLPNATVVIEALALAAIAQHGIDALPPFTQKCLGPSVW